MNGEYIDILSNLTINENKIRGYNKIINDNKIIIPIPFNISKYINSALPLIALQHSEVKIMINYNNLDSLINYDTDGELQKIYSNEQDYLLVKYIYIDEKQRLEYVGNKIDTLIEQVQYADNFVIDINKNEEYTIPVNFLNNSKEIMLIPQVYDSIDYSNINIVKNKFKSSVEYKNDLNNIINDDIEDIKIKKIIEDDINKNYMFLSDIEVEEVDMNNSKYCDQMIEAFNNANDTIKKEIMIINSYDYVYINGNIINNYKYEWVNADKNDLINFVNFNVNLVNNLSMKLVDKISTNNIILYQDNNYYTLMIYNGIKYIPYDTEYGVICKCDDRLFVRYVNDIYNNQIWIEYNNQTNRYYLDQIFYEDTLPEDISNYENKYILYNTARDTESYYNVDVLTLKKCIYDDGYKFIDYDSVNNSICFINDIDDIDETRIRNKIYIRVKDYNYDTYKYQKWITADCNYLMNYYVDYDVDDIIYEIPKKYIGDLIFYYDNNKYHLMKYTDNKYEEIITNKNIICKINNNNEIYVKFYIKKVIKQNGNIIDTKYIDNWMKYTDKLTSNVNFIKETYHYVNSINDLPYPSEEVKGKIYAVKDHNQYKFMKGDDHLQWIDYDDINSYEDQKILCFNTNYNTNYIVIKYSNNIWYEYSEPQNTIYIVNNTNEVYTKLKDIWAIADEKFIKEYYPNYYVLNIIPIEEINNTELNINDIIFCKDNDKYKLMIYDGNKFVDYNVNYGSICKVINDNDIYIRYLDDINGNQVWIKYSNHFNDINEIEINYNPVNSNKKYFMNHIYDYHPNNVEIILYNNNKLEFQEYNNEWIINKDKRNNICIINNTNEIYINKIVEVIPVKDYYAKKYIITKKYIPIIKEIEVLYSGRIRERIHSERFYSLLKKHECHTKNNYDGIYVYPFALYPELQQPSGSCNLSQCGQLEFRIIFNDEINKLINYHKEYVYKEDNNGNMNIIKEEIYVKNKEQKQINIRIGIYDNSLNILRIVSGLGGLLFI